MSVSQATRVNPYIGPRPFQRNERMYGRERELRDLLSLLVAERIVLLHSPSGAGKTSLVNAALIPALEQREFLVLPPMRVNTALSNLDTETLRQNGNGAGPARNRYLESLIQSLEADLPAEQRQPDTALAGLSLAEYLTLRSGGTDGVVLIFDQFEEILTVDPTNIAAKNAFFQQVGHLLRDKRFWALFSMREDYVAALDPYRKYLPTRLDTTFRLDLLSVNGALQAIQKPAASQQVRFEDNAARQLVDDLRMVTVQQADGSLLQREGPSVEPVQLQVVCYRLWERLDAADSQIDLDDLQELGDVNAALGEYYRTRVEHAASESGVSERAIREWIERKLITSQGMRGQVLQGAEGEATLPGPAVRALIDAYLVRKEERRGAVWLELAHDRLVTPVRGDNKDWFERNLSTLQRQADLWQQQNRPSGLLLRGEALQEAESWAGTAPLLTSIEQDFLQLCREARAAEERERERNAQIQRQNEEITVRNRRIQRLLAIVGVVGAIALLAALIALGSYWQANLARIDADNKRTLAETAQANEALARAEADKQAQINRVRYLALAAENELDSDPLLSVLLATQAYSESLSLGTDTPPDAWRNLQRALQRSRTSAIYRFEQRVDALAPSPDGTRLLVGSGSNGYVLDAASGESLLTLVPPDLGEDQIMRRVAFTPDGRQLVTLNLDGQIRIWDAQTGAFLLQLGADTPGYDDVAFDFALSPDGRWLASGGDRLEIAIWSLANWSQLQVWPAHDQAIQSLAFSADSQWLASGGDDGFARIWDVARGSQLSSYAVDSPVVGVALSPDKTRLAVAAQSTEGQVWDVNTESPLFRLRGHTGNLSHVAYSRDGRLLVSAASDGRLRVWSAADGTQLLNLAGHTQAVLDFALRPDQAEVLSASLDGSVRAWQLGLLYPGSLTRMAFNPQAGLLAGGGDRGLLLTWRQSDGAPLGAIDSEQGTILGLALSPDGRWLASSGTETRDIRIWDVQSGRLLETLEHAEIVFALQFSADQRWLFSVTGAGGNDNEAVYVWEVATGRELLRLQMADPAQRFDLYSLALAPDGRRVASGDFHGGVALWDLSTGELLQYTQLGTDGVIVTGLAFSPDGQRLLAGLADSRAIVWSPADDQRRELPAAAPVAAVAWSADGRQVAVSDESGALQLWDADDVTQSVPTYVLAHTAAPNALYYNGPDLYVAHGNQIAVYPLSEARLLERAAQAGLRSFTRMECDEFNLNLAEPFCPAQ